MKRLFPVIVTTRRIEVPTEKFNLDELQALAKSMLELGGFIQPPVLRRDGENFTIVTGHKQVAAAHLALMIAPTLAAILPVFIIEEKTEAAILTQVTATAEPIASVEILTPAKTSIAKKEKSPTVVELKAKCKALGIKKYSKLKKVELLKLLANHV